MSKRKPITASKHVRRPKMAAKAQRAAQAIIRGPKEAVRAARAGPIEAAPKRESDLPQETLIVENLAQPLLEMAQSPPQDKSMTGSNPKRQTNFFPAPVNMPAYQAKLVEMAQANVQLAFEFTQRIATIRSPVELPGIIAALTSKQFAMLWRHSAEIAALSRKR